MAPEELDSVLSPARLSELTLATGVITLPLLDEDPEKPGEQAHRPVAGHSLQHFWTVSNLSPVCQSSPEPTSTEGHTWVTVLGLLGSRSQW